MRKLFPVIVGVVRRSACSNEFTWPAPRRFSMRRVTNRWSTSPRRTILSGTGITLQNWKQRQRFMPVRLQALYGQEGHWHIGAQVHYRGGPHT